MRLFYATAAPADFISAHRAWASGVEYENEVSLTFSGQIETFIERFGEAGLMVSGHPDGKQLAEARIEIRHIPPKPASGWRWHAERVRYSRLLLNLAREFRADVVVIDSGTVPYWAMPAFRRAGMVVIPVFHNCLYPAKGTSGVRKLFVSVAKRALKKTHPIFVSREAKRQVGHGLEIRAQFRREYFSRVAPASFASPFNVLFVGRVDETKGIFDVVEATRLCGAEVSWTICGSGADLDRLREVGRGLPIDIRGWTSPEEQIELRSRCQAVIVPSKSDLNEGMAMSAVEAILSGRPLITNRAVPALEVLRPASVEAEPDNPRSYADAVLSLARNQQRWQTLVDACGGLGDPFYDRRHSLTAALEEVLCPASSSYVPPV